MPLHRTFPAEDVLIRADRKSLWKICLKVYIFIAYLQQIEIIYTVVSESPLSKIFHNKFPPHILYNVCINT